MATVVARALASPPAKLWPAKAVRRKSRPPAAGWLHRPAAGGRNWWWTRGGRAFSCSGRWSQERERIGQISPTVAAGGGEVSEAGEAQESDHQVVQTRHHVPGLALRQSRGIFVEDHIATVVEAILDPPIRSRQGE